MATKKKAEPKPERKKVETFYSTQKVILTAEEIAASAHRAAATLQTRDEKEAELKAAQKHGKSVIEELEAQLRTLSCEVSTGSCYRSVECERTYHYDDGTLTETRVDTGEELHSRKLSAVEMQPTLPFEENGDAE